jgi:hypothetical protein
MKRLFAFSIIIFFSIFSSNGQQSEKIVFEYIKLDNSVPNWGELKFNNTLEFDVVDKNGIPTNLIIKNQVKLLTIKFRFTSGNDAQFSYKLLGLAGTWSKLSRKNEVSYFNLPPGKYTFIVRLYENGGFTLVDVFQIATEVLNKTNNILTDCNNPIIDEMIVPIVRNAIFDIIFDVNKSDPISLSKNNWKNLKTPDKVEVPITKINSKLELAI